MSCCAALVHEALVYSSRDELLDYCVPFARDGVERGERVYCVVRRDNVEPLRESLGAAAAKVDFCDASAWYRMPAQTLTGYRDYVAEGGGVPVRVVGEVAWPDRSAAGIREWSRYESILNSVFADANAQIVCPYDARALPDSILEHALRTHPVAVVDGERRESSDYAEHPDLSELLDQQTLEPVPPGATLLPGENLTALRRRVRDLVAGVGVPSSRHDDVVVAINEIVANAIRHGGRPIEVTWWNETDRVLFDVADGGGSLSDRDAGWLPPAGLDHGGYGLWLARTLCDLVEIRSGTCGTTVRLHVRLDDAT